MQLPSHAFFQEGLVMVTDKQGRWFFFLAKYQCKRDESCVRIGALFSALLYLGTPPNILSICRTQNSTSQSKLKKGGKKKQKVIWVRYHSLIFPTKHSKHKETYSFDTTLCPKVLLRTWLALLCLHTPSFQSLKLSVFSIYSGDSKVRSNTLCLKQVIKLTLHLPQI